jgi:DNA polymerase III epsilon subunit-like protein
LNTLQAPLTRSSAIAWAREIVSNPDVVYCDTETTGLGVHARICDIAVIAQDGTVLLDTLVNPGEPIPEGASKVHGITDEMVANELTWLTIREEVDRAIRGKTVVIYNRGYDEPILQQHNESLGYPHFEADFRCAMLAYSDYDGTTGNYGSLKWHKLDTAAAHFGIDPGGHRALSDAETTRRVVHAMALAGGPIDVGTFEQLPPADVEEAPDLPDDDTPATTGWPEHRFFATEDLFVLLRTEMAARDQAEARIGELREMLQERMSADHLQSFQSEETGAIARIDQRTSLKVTSKQSFESWSRTNPTGRLFLMVSGSNLLTASLVTAGTTAFTSTFPHPACSKRSDVFVPKHLPAKGPGWLADLRRKGPMRRSIENN